MAINRDILNLVNAERAQAGIEAWDIATERAIELMHMGAGVSPDDTDITGEEITDSAQSYLTMFMVRCPDQAELLLEWVRAWS